MKTVIPTLSLLPILTILAFSPLHGGEKTPMPDAGQAVVTTVTLIKELQETVAKAKAGTTILLKKGTYNEPCNLKGKGSQGLPIVIRAETLGGVELLNQLTLEGEHLSLIGFRFKDNGGIAVKSGIACRISRCYMTNLNPAQWLRVDSKSRSIEIDRGLFEKKENNREKDRDCQLMRIEVTKQKESHLIHLNHSNYPEGTAPKDCKIANNILYQEKGAKNVLITFVKNQEPEKWTWQGNIYQGVLGISPRTGLEQSSAFSKRTGELLLPTAQTLTALRTAMNTNELAIDLAGNARPEKRTVGAFQYVMKQNKAKPLGAEDVGLLTGMEGEK